ncbi:DUF6318 family protein [Actinomyces howellii]|nr:DUF6318 family protein [Actinomyces howellii]
MAMPEPGRLEGMDENSPAGASASAAYFLTLYPYVFATGDLTAWQDMSEEGCNFCNSVVESVNDIHDSGGWVDPWHQDVVVQSYGTVAEDTDTLLIDITIDSAEIVLHDIDGSIESVTPADPDLAFTVQVHWNGDRWMIAEGAVA